MRVLMLGDWPWKEPQGGLENHNLNLFEALKGTPGVEIQFSTFRPEGISWSDRRSLRVKLAFNLPVRFFFRASKHANCFRPNIIHVQGSSVGPYSLFMIFSPFVARRVVTVHGFSSHEARAGSYGFLPRVFSPYYRFVEWALFSRAHMIILVNERKRGWFEDNYGGRFSHKVKVIRNGVNAIANDAAVHSLGTREAERQQLELPQDAFVIFLAKGFAPSSGQDYLLRAVRLVASAGKNVHLVLAGDGYTRVQMIALIKELGLETSVQMPGTVPNSEVLRILATADLVVLPSVKLAGAEEGLSVFLLESMGMGKPVIATRVGGNPDLIRDGVNGLLVPEKDAEALAAAITRLMDDPELCRRLGESARREVIESWTWEKVASEVKDAYNEMMAQGR